MEAILFAIQILRKIIFSELLSLHNNLPFLAHFKTFVINLTLYDINIPNTCFYKKVLCVILTYEVNMAKFHKLLTNKTLKNISGGGDTALTTFSFSIALHKTTDLILEGGLRDCATLGLNYTSSILHQLLMYNLFW